MTERVGVAAVTLVIATSLSAFSHEATTWLELPMQSRGYSTETNGSLRDSNLRSLINRSESNLAKSTQIELCMYRNTDLSYAGTDQLVNPTLDDVFHIIRANRNEMKAAKCFGITQRHQATKHYRISTADNFVASCLCAPCQACREAMKAADRFTITQRHQATKHYRISTADNFVASCLCAPCQVCREAMKAADRFEITQRHQATKHYRITTADNFVSSCLCVPLKNSRGGNDAMPISTSWLARRSASPSVSTQPE